MNDRLLCFIDFEFNGTNEKYLNLVSCALILHNNGKVKSRTYWLHSDPLEQARLKADILKLRDADAVFVAFNAVSEALSFIALRIDPRKALWIDLQTEWKMLTNHATKYAYGDQLIKGEVKHTKPPPPKWEIVDGEEGDHSRREASLSAMTYRLLHIKIDTDRKKEIRNLIISKSAENINAARAEILEYNLSDVEHLPDLLDVVRTIYRSASPPITWEHLQLRGKTSADVALMTSWGYPVDAAQVRRFAKNVPLILAEIGEDINKQFPKKGFFEQDKLGKYVMKQKAWKTWVEDTGLKAKWRKTEKGEVSLALDAFEDFFQFRHDFPAGNVGAQALRYLKTKQAMHGFMPKLKGETFFDSLGSDSRVRAYLNPYGAQSSRFQPKATSYLPLKSAWLRSLIVPSAGRAIVGVDYSSEEFLISALWAEDKNMVAAYESGDVYLYFAKLAGAVPWAGTKEQYKKERDAFKSTTLGISYLMGPDSLARKLTQDTGVPHTVEQAQELIDMFMSSYPDYAEKIELTQYEYIHDSYQQLPCGWVMYGDNPNRRSVANCPIQGRGATILRLAITRALDAGLKVILPLHDALYIEIAEEDNTSADLLVNIMRQAFMDIFPTSPKAKLVRLDATMWGPGLGEGEKITPGGNKIKTQKIYIDPRAQAEYLKFHKYL